MAWYDAILGPLNLIDLVEGLVRGVAYGDVTPHRIALPHPEHPFWEENSCSPWSLNEMRDLLASYHVETYGRGFNSEEIWVHVKEKQARFAEYLLARAGAPVIMGTVDGRNQAWANNPAHGGRMPARWDDNEREFKEREARG